MKKSRLLYGMLALLLVGSTFSVAGNVAASAEEISVAQEEVMIENAITPRASISTSYSINAPSFIIDDTSYIFAVKYDWHAGSGGDRVAGSLYSSSNYSIRNDSSHLTEISFPDQGATTSATLCETWRTYYRTYNTSTDQYSSDYVSVEMDDGDAYVYGRHCQKAPKAMFTNKASATYYCDDYDVTNYNVWSHGGGTNYIIIATVRYQDVCYNIKVKIPFLGYNTTSVTINNVKFSLRTGPNKCSLKCNSSTVYSSDVDFAFAVVGKSNAILNQVNFVGD